MDFRKTGVLALLLSMSCLPSFADEIIIPFALDQKQFSKELKKEGLDFTDGKHSLGFVKNEGMKSTVYSYKNLKNEQLDKIKQAAFKSVRK